MKLLNAFSLNMFSSFPANVKVEEISLEEARKHLAAGFESAVGHPDTAVVFGQQLGIEVPSVRSTVALKDEVALVGQYRGPRLPEGAKELPAGSTIQWLLVTVN